MAGLGAKQRLRILEITWDRSISITSALFRLTRAVQIPDFAAALILLLLFGSILGGLVMVARRQGILLFSSGKNVPAREVARIETLEWAALIFFAFAFSPQTTARHMVLTLLIYAVAIPIFLVQEERMPKILLAFAGGLMVASSFAAAER